jgi:hypothetical protein
MLAEEENSAGFARINRELIGKAEALDSPRRVVLDMACCCRSGKAGPNAGRGRGVDQRRQAGSEDDAAIVRRDGRKDCRLAGGGGVEAGDGRSQIRRPEGEGRRGVCEMRWKDRVYRSWVSPARRTTALWGGRRRLPEGKCNLQCRGKVEISYFEAGSSCSRRLHKGLPFPPA